MQQTSVKQVESLPNQVFGMCFFRAILLKMLSKEEAKMSKTVVDRICRSISKRYLKSF